MATGSNTSDHDDDEKPEAAEGVDGETAEDAARGEGDAEAPPAAAPKKSATKSGAKRARRAPPPPPKKGSLGTSMVLFVIVVGGLAAGFAFLGKETGGGGPAAPKWKTGQEVDVEITLVSTDRQDLGCASADEVAGRHCAFETQTKAWSKSSNEDDKLLLKPYTTTDGVQFTAAGVWSEPSMSGKLPATRFAVKCKYKVEGKLAKPGIRWSSDGPWYAQTGEWYAGSVSGCTVTP